MKQLAKSIFTQVRVLLCVINKSQVTLKHEVITVKIFQSSHLCFYKGTSMKDYTRREYTYFYLLFVLCMALQPN